MFTLRDNTSGLWWLDAAGAGAARGNPPLLAGAAVPGQLAPAPGDNLVTVRERSGVIFFANGAPTDFSGFAKDLLALSPAGADLRIIWLDNPRQPRGEWRGAQIAVTRDRLAAPAALPLGGLRLRLAVGAALRVLADRLEFTSGVTVGRDGAPPIIVAAATLPLAGFDLGTLQGKVSLSGEALAAHGLAIRHDTVGGAVDFPLFNPDASLTGDLTVDPLLGSDSRASRIDLAETTAPSAFRCRPRATAVLLAGRGRLVFTAAGLALEGSYALAGGGQPTVLNCGLDEGEVVTMAGAAALEFAPRAGSGTGVSLRGDTLDYAWHGRGRNAQRQSLPLGWMAADFPIAP
jgi:hypothetical protein